MINFSRPAAAAFCGLFLLCSAAAADPALKAGDPAPPLAVSKFVKGEPVKKFEKGKIYVVEFWATWCPPCRESIPHLTQLQKANTDVIFTGVDVGEDEKTVSPFVTNMGDKMDYRVAVDDLTTDGGATNKAYMEAAGQEGIPTAFIIDKDSNIAWIGHPMAMEPVLKKVVAGTFDIKKAAAETAAEEKVGALIGDKDFDGAIKKSQELITANPDLTGTLGVLQFELLLKAKNDAVAAAAKAEQIMPKVDEAEALNEMAWGLASAPKNTPQTLATAQKLSEASLKKADGNPEFVDTLARVYADKSDFKKAIELETKALDKTTDEKLKAELTKTLEAYKAGKLPAVTEE
jgi:thiol-disulfide isomerase/thioredoxin